MSSNFKYTKSNPKVNDYNPINHMPQYSSYSRGASEWISHTKLTQSSPQGFFGQSSPRLYKGKPRTEVSNPIIGNTTRYDTNRNTDNTLAQTYILVQQSGMLPNDRISGAYRKPVSNVAYVNPFTIKRSPR